MESAGMMKMATGEGSPSGRVPERAPERFLVAIEACGGGTPDLLCSPMFLGYMDIYRRKKSVRGAMRGPRGWGARPGGQARLPASWPPWSFLDFNSKSPGSRSFQKSRSRRFHSVWTPFDIPFPRNTEIGKKTAIWAGPPVNRLVPKIIQKCKIKPINIQKR